MKRNTWNSPESALAGVTVMALFGMAILTIFMAKVLFKLTAILLTVLFISPLRVFAEHRRLRTRDAGLLKAVFTVFTLVTAACITLAMGVPSTLRIDAGLECASFLLLLVVAWLADTSLHRLPRRANDLTSYLKFVTVQRQDRD